MTMDANELRALADALHWVQYTADWQACDQAADYLRACADAQPVPAGWKLVPVEPTQAMNNAGLSAVNQYGKRLVWETYKAMLAAAPAAPQAEPKRDWSVIDAAIREYLDNYELIGENDAGADACYTPTERELYLIYDAINGLFADESFVAAISAPRAEPKREPSCLWSRADDDTDVWETSCGHAFTIIEGTPSDNHMEFCCYCGRRVDEEIGGSDE